MSSDTLRAAKTEKKTANLAGHEAPNETAAVPVHFQLTTGDVELFRAVAERMFGEAFPDVERVELEVGLS